ncbi:MAG: hypothetical protein M1827_001685 [Pycnora praestabilis]|nr:MAG: hypothetical protein M1827_001685 [Pycnora praestabilis]
MDHESNFDADEDKDEYSDSNSTHTSEQPGAATDEVGAATTTIENETDLEA